MQKRTTVNVIMILCVVVIFIAARSLGQKIVIHMAIGTDSR